MSGLPFSTINTVPGDDIVRLPSGQTYQFPQNRPNYHQFSFLTSKIHVQSCRGRLFLPADSSSGEEALGLLQARLIEIQMSIWRRYEHILPNGTAERSGSECGVLLSRCRKRSSDRAHVCSRILFGGRGSQAPRLKLHLIRRCCFITMLDRQIRLGSGVDLFLSRSRRPP